MLDGQTRQRIKTKIAPELQEEWVYFTPDLAAQWLPLFRGEHNVRFTESKAKLYARDMASGNWKQTADPIYITHDKKKGLSGQHRLWAISQSGCAQWFKVVYVDDEIMPIIDSHNPRRVSGMLDVEGLIDTKDLAPVLRCLFRVLRGNWSNGDRGDDPSRLDYIDLVERVPELYPAVQRTKSKELKKLQNGMTKYLAVLHVLTNTYCPQDFDDFLRVLETGLPTWGGGDNPARRLRDYLLLRVYSGNKNNRITVAILIKAWNKFLNRQTCKQLRLDAREEFPVIQLLPGECFNYKFWHQEIMSRTPNEVTPFHRSQN